MAKRKLGRGLDLLIASSRQPATADSEDEVPPAPAPETPHATAGPGEDGIVHVDPAAIDVNPHQPRKRFPEEELADLKASISREGLLQPVVVRRRDNGYQLVAGERRLRACQELGIEAVPAIVREVPEERLLEVALIENIHRENLGPIELAEAYRELMSLKSWTQDELATRLAISRSAVSNTLRLLELPADIQESLAEGSIHPGHAKVLLSVTDTPRRDELFRRIGDERLSVRELEREAQGSGSRRPVPGRGGKAGGRRRKGSSSTKKPYLVSLEEELGEALGSKVRISEKGGKGVLSVEFYSKEDFERLRALLLGHGPGIV